MDLALNNLQRLICHKIHHQTKPNQTKPKKFYQRNKHQDSRHCMERKSSDTIKKERKKENCLKEKKKKRAMSYWNPFYECIVIDPEVLPEDVKPLNQVPSRYFLITIRLPIIYI